MQVLWSLAFTSFVVVSGTIQVLFSSSSSSSSSSLSQNFTFHFYKDLARQTQEKLQKHMMVGQAKKIALVRFDFLPLYENELELRKGQTVLIIEEDRLVVLLCLSFTCAF